MANPLGITEVVLRDAHQSLLATRFRIEDMLPICEKLDRVGFWSMESWGGATFDACIRYLGEDPWERLRTLKKAMPRTPQQMLFRGQNILGYRHYADDVVDKFVERAAENGIDVFRIFDAMNDIRNMERAIRATVAVGKHAQGTLSYTVSPVHTLDTWLDLAKELEDLGVHSIAIKDMAGLLKPYDGFELVRRLKQTVSVPIHLHCHATTGLSVPTLIKAAEAGVDNVDAAISSMSMTYGHSPTETIVAALEGQERDTGLDMSLLEEIAAYFREVRKKYADFEGSLKGVDSRILVSQVPGGMLTNMENQLREQGASDRFDAVLAEIPKVREDLGYLPLVTPTSQIVGTQAVINILEGERYKTITRESAGVLKGEYGRTPAPVNPELQAQVLDGNDPITCRPADLLESELGSLTRELKEFAEDNGIRLASNEIEDVLTYALFPQIGGKFLKNRGNPAAFEPRPCSGAAAAQSLVPASPEAGRVESYTVTVNGVAYAVQVGPGDAITEIRETAASPRPASAGERITSPMAGNIFRVNVRPGQVVAAQEVVIVLEAMKMETEIRARRGGTVVDVLVKEGDSVAVGDVLVTLG